MPIIYQQTTDKDIHEQVGQKHWNSINKLKYLSFNDFYFFGETVQALGFSPLGLSGFFGSLIALFNEVSKVESNLDVTVFNVVMASRQYSTYASPFGLGVKFYTYFTDGTCIISANFDTPAINDNEEKLYKSAAPRTIEAAWADHQRWIDKLTSEGKQANEHLSFAGYLKLAQQEDTHLIKHQLTARASAGNLFVTILSTITSLSLFAGIALMFWFLPRIVHELYPACWFVRNVNEPSLLQNSLIILGCIAMSWVLAHFLEKNFTVDGIGMKFFGQSPSPDSHGYISTKWLVVVFIPIIPVKAYQIVEENLGGQSATSYSVTALKKLDWAQVRETMWKSKWGYLILAIVFISFGIWTFSECM